MTSPGSVDTPTTVERAEATTGPSPMATPMPEADPPAAAQIPSEEPASLASEIARRKLGEAAPDRLRGTRRVYPAFVGAVVTAATEPAIPAPSHPTTIAAASRLAGADRDHRPDGDPRPRRLHLAIRPDLGGQPRHPGDAAGDVPARSRRRAAALHAQHGEQSRQHPHLRGSGRRDAARLFGAEPGRGLAPLRRPARLPGLAQLAADGLRRDRAARGRLRHPQVQPPHAPPDRRGPALSRCPAYVVEENVLAWRSVRLHAAEASQRRASRTSATSCAGCR